MQLSVGGMLGLVAGMAVCVWLFRFGVLWGMVGLSIAKHVVVAYLCQVLGVDRKDAAPARGVPGPAPRATAGARRG